MRHLHSIVVLACIALTACGSGGSSSSSSSGGSSGGGSPKKTRTPTPVVSAQTLYVRQNGDDANPGTDPDMALKTITAAAKSKLLRAGTTVYVGRGTYMGRVEITSKSGTADFPIRLVADVTGANTHDRPGEVVLDAAGDTTAIAITKSAYVSIEGFLITGATPQTGVSATAVLIRSASHNNTVRDCLIGNGTEADGIRIAGSSAALIFDNLIFSNDRGIVVSGAAPDARIINNTIVNHLRAGISIAPSGGNAPDNASVMNNIVQGNDSGIAISVDDTNYEGDYNLVFESDLQDQAMAYSPQPIRGSHDVNVDALFENIPQTDVRLTDGSPAIDAGTGAIGPDLATALFKRSATSDGRADRTPPDLGYHYPRQ